MKDCDLRLPGEEFCADCPLRPVREQCQREGYCSRVSLHPPAPLVSRIGVFMLSAVALMMMPVVVRNLYRIRVEDDMSQRMIHVLWVVTPPIMVVVGIAALIGVYAAIFGFRSSKRA